MIHRSDAQYDRGLDIDYAKYERPFKGQSHRSTILISQLRGISENSIIMS